MFNTILSIIIITGQIEHSLLAEKAIYNYNGDDIYEFCESSEVRPAACALFLKYNQDLENLKICPNDITRAELDDLNNNHNAYLEYWQKGCE